MDLFRKAAQALFLADRHPFWDGQKRTAFELADFILRENGYRFDRDDRAEIMAIDYDIQGLKITEFQDWRRVLTGYPSGNKVTIIFKVKGPYSIEGSSSTDYAVILND